MRKKLIISLILFMSFVLLIACDGNETTIELTDMPTTEVPTTDNLTTVEPTTEEPTTEEPTTEEPTTEVPTTEAPTTVESVFLPDLEDLIEPAIMDLFEDLGLTYSFTYESDLDLNEGTFIKYGSGLEAGNSVFVNETIEIVLSTQTIYLPDLTGMTITEIDRYLITRGITNYDIEIVTDNTVEDETFVGYETFEIGDQVSPRYQFIIYIGYNSEKLPDLTNLIQRQISDLLSEKLIQFEFSYVINDDYPEDTFAYYEDFEIGDFYDEVSIINVVLYKNTFTDADESLLISKYIDSETDSAIELYNPTSESISLNDYHIAIYNNGSYEVNYRIELEDVDLLPGETYLVVSNASDADLLLLADLVSDQLVFDGNDVVQLRYKNNTYIDTIYQIGDRALIMDNETFVRRDMIDSGNRTLTISEWTAFVPGYYDIIGTHPLIIEEQLTYTQTQINEFLSRGFYDALGGMTQVTLDYISDGDTAGFVPGFTGDARVRFIGVDTPETYPVEQTWGPEGKAYTTTILQYAKANNKPIYIQSDPDVGYTEGYGRHLGLIWVDLGTDILSIDIKDYAGNVLFTEELTGVILINYLLVKNGFSADEYKSTSTLIINNRYMPRWFDEAEKFAKENNLGIHE